ncbi:L-Ala-D/L-Glu epimerase [Vibrio aerogenes CECT 7868]|uniref:Dipeptide epimerase n=1 Tax=Vibrio aerogenes CECT 7868 TaxID=1216006 RepID=A0A1M5Z465_9VIBR|nr:N-acetyl-D-Glu racemase DgcA [Vibrio aerogenes]SHI18971.1 L-Ala-D/L-Glu epimerase [Vibrio aerogenes CECT 7868]
MRNLEIDVVELPLSRPFTISRGTRTAVTVVRVNVEENGFIGLGECTPTPRYGESPESVVAQLEDIRGSFESGLTREELQALMPAGAARNVLDCALWRLEAASTQKNLWSMSGVSQPESVITAETISLGSVDAMKSSAKKAVKKGAILLKIKLNAEQIVEKVAAIRSVAPETILIIDANEAWAGCDLPVLFKALTSYDITMIEQPLPAGDDSILADFEHVIPVCADESCHVNQDIDSLSSRYEFINIKLDKCGGLTEALKMVEQAKAKGMRLMVGCMLGSSLAMDAALPIAAQCELIDLDGPIWLAGDSVPYLEYREGRIWT